MKKLLLAVTLLPLAGCGEIVDTGHRGVKTEFGKVVSESLPEGFYFYNPFTSSIIEMDVRTKKYEVETSTYTRDIQQAKLHIIVNYNLEKTKVHEMYQNVGRDWEDRLIPQTVNGTVKTIIGKWDAVDLISNRAKAQQEIQDNIASVMKEKDIHVTRIEIANIDYTQEFEQAVEAKVTAIQRAAEAENKTKQIQEEARQKVITAQAEAESMRIRANALTQNAALVQYEAVQKWDGHLPQYNMGGAVPFINVK